MEFICTGPAVGHDRFGEAGRPEVKRLVPVGLFS
jgi:hypothetical protein